MLVFVNLLHHTEHLSRNSQLHVATSLTQSWSVDEHRPTSHTWGEKRPWGKVWMHTPTHRTQQVAHLNKLSTTVYLCGRTQTFTPTPPSAAILGRLGARSRAALHVRCVCVFKWWRTTLRLYSPDATLVPRILPTLSAVWAHVYLTHTQQGVLKKPVISLLITTSHTNNCNNNYCSHHLISGLSPFLI